MAKTKSNLEVLNSDAQDRLDDEMQRLYDGQKAVGKQALYQTAAYTWLEIKELGKKNHMVLMYDKFSPDDTLVPVVEVETNGAVWCEPEQVVRIGDKLKVPRATVSKLSRKKMRPLPEQVEFGPPIKRPSVKRDYSAEQRRIQFPWNDDDMKWNVDQLLILQKDLTNHQKAGIVRRIVHCTLYEGSLENLVVDSRQVQDRDTGREFHYYVSLSGLKRDFDAKVEHIFGFEAYTVAVGMGLEELLRPLGVQHVSCTPSALVLSWGKNAIVK